MIYVFGCIALVLLDFVIKKTMQKRFSSNQEFDEQKHVRWGLVYNKGAAMGIGKHHRPILIGVTVFATSLLFAEFVKSIQGKKMLASLGFMFATAGAINNAYERIVKKKVTDYISFPKLPGKLKDIFFNFSDFFLFIGGLLLVLAEVLPICYENIKKLLLKG